MRVLAFLLSHSIWVHFIIGRHRSLIRVRHDSSTDVVAKIDAGPSGETFR
jgi:hypothetical protein